MIPRWYQQQANDAAWQYLATQTGNPLIVLPTGAGKSLVIAMLCRQALEFGAQVIVLQHRKELIQQNAEKIQILLPDIPVGLYSAGLQSKQTQQPILCAGIQSVYRKAADIGERQLIVIDEAHLVSAADESMYGQFLSDIIELNPAARVVGLTATPFRTGEGPICGKKKLFQRICFEAFTGDLIEQGFLCEITNKPSEQVIDTSNLKLRGGEFVESDLQRVFGGDDTVLNACTEIVARTQDRRSILVFSSGVAHADNVADTLHRLTGEQTAVITGETLPIERAAYLQQFKTGALRWLVNCDVLCLDEQTEILTTDGWTTIDEMSETHQIAAWDFDGSITFASPKLIVKRPRGTNEYMVSLKTNGVDIRVTDNHRMIAWSGSEHSGMWNVVPAKSLVNKKAVLPAHGIASPLDVVCDQVSVSAKQRSARIRSLSWVYRKKYGMSDSDSKTAAEANVDSRVNLLPKDPVDLTDDECRFIGFWIGDGTRSNERFAVSQSMAYPDNIEWFEGVLSRSQIHFTKSIYKATSKTKHESVRWCFSKGTGGLGQSVSGGISHLIPYLEKDGTRLFWGLSTQQFQALLEGWWMADGLHHAKRQEKRVSCVNKKLIDLMQAIATCRGIRTSLRVCSKPRSLKHSQQYTLSWSNRQCINAYKNRFAYDQTPIRQGERVWCVTSVTGNIITRRSGKVAVVGNTTGFDAPCIDAIAILRATMSPGLFAQMVGRGLRKHDSKQNCLVLDFGNNIERHGSLDDRNYGRATSSKPGSAKPQEKNGRGRECLNCKLDVPAGEPECPECGFRFPGRHQANADTDSQLTGEVPPEEWRIDVCRWGKHFKRNDPEAPPTLRIDYECQPVDGPSGNLTAKHVSEWVCIEHEGFARVKACLWWQQRSISEVPSTVDEALELLNRGACRMPAKVTTVRDGKYQRIKSVEFVDEIPEEWLDEMVPEQDTPILSEYGEELPF
jgi:superfamily II DNA or RNA helicase